MPTRSQPRRPKDGMLLAKGTIFVNVRACVEARFGIEAWSRVLAALPEDARVVIEGVVSMGWYETRHQLLLYAVTESVLGNGDLVIVDELARYAADVDLGGIYRLLLPVLSPGAVLERGMTYWSRFQNSGVWEFTRQSPTHATATLRDFAVADAALCRYLRAYMRRMMELSGAKAVRVEHVRCRTRGEGDCCFVGTWRD